METMSPSSSFLWLGMPWITTSLTEAHTEAGYPPYPRNDGFAPWLSMNFRTSRSISSVVTPGRTREPASARA